MSNLSSDPKTLREEDEGYCLLIGGTTLVFLRDWEPNARRCKRLIEYTITSGPIPYGASDNDE